MPFDANLVLADTTADWTFANLVTSNYGTPTSLTRNAGGFVVVDLLDLSTTPADGLACIFVADEAGAAADDALTLVLQGCDAVAFGSSVQNLAQFDILGATAGIILGSEAPCTVIRRFSTRLRYIRVDASCVAADNFHTCQVLLAHYPFHTL